LISWGKRQDILDQKFANLFQEYQKLVERCSGLNSKLDLALHKIEEAKLKQNTICKNNDYIKEEVLSIGKHIHHNLNKNKESSSRPEAREDLLEIKLLVKEVKSLILS
jgi:hypothetical protein